MEQIIAIVIFLLASAVFNWIKRKQEEGENQPGSSPEAPPSSAPRPASPADNWEEQIRRLVRGEQLGPPPVSRPAPPPIPVASPVAPPPIRTGPPRPVPAAPLPHLARSSIPVPNEGEEEEMGLPVAPVTFTQANLAHERAVQVHSLVSQRMQNAALRLSTHTVAKVQIARSPLTERVRRMVREPESQRAVILASIVLGPPKSVEHPG
jgi:hypothetical protein